jgi:hypothetical protein
MIENKRTESFSYSEFKKLEELFAWADFYNKLPNWNITKSANIDKVQEQIESQRKKLFKN